MVSSNFDKSFGIFALFLIALISIESASALDCSNVVVNDRQGLGDWLGNVTFIVPQTTTEAGWNVDIQFDQKFTGIGVWDVWANSDPESGFVSMVNRDENAVLTEGEELSFRFRVNYYQVPIPNVVSLKFFQQELCL